MSRPRLDLTGQTFGRLCVLGFAGISNHKKQVVRVRCQCGNTTTVYASALKDGHTRSCGCLRREKTNERKGFSR